MRALLAMLYKLNDLSEQKNVACKETQTYLNLYNNLKEQLKGLKIELNEDDKNEKNCLKKKYAYAVKLRRAVIVVLAANRLIKLQKHTDELDRDPMIIYKNGNPLLACLRVIQYDKFPEGSLTNITKEIIERMEELPNSVEESKILIGTLMEMPKVQSGPKMNKSIRIGRTIIGYLKEGLSEIGNKCNRLRLGSFSNIPMKDIISIDKIFYKDLIAQEYIKRIQKSLNKLKLIPELENKLVLYKDQEETLMGQLENSQGEISEHERNLKMLLDKIKEIEDNTVTTEIYKKVIDELNNKKEEVESLQNELVNFLLNNIGKIKRYFRQSAK